MYMFIVHFSNGSKIRVAADCPVKARALACRIERVFSVVDVVPA